MPTPWPLRLSLAVLALASYGCADDSGPTEDVACTRDSDCGGQQRCVDRTCRDDVETTGGNASSTSSTESGSASTSSTSSGVGSSSASDSGGTSSSCDGWEPPALPGWSLQDCLTDQCPEGEVCRYNPTADCGEHPVCVNPDTYACFCETEGPESAGFACPCPGYDGPLDELGHAPLECNTFGNPGPVTYNEQCGL